MKSKKKPKWNQRTHIKGALRRIFIKSPIIKQVKDLAVHPTIKGKRGGKRYICAHCKKTYSPLDIQVDHIKPLIPIHKTIRDFTYNELINNMFCSIDNLQVLCYECHKIKTAKERKERKKEKQNEIQRIVA